MSLKLHTAPTAEPLTLDEARTHLRIDPGLLALDAAIMRAVAAAREEVEQLLQRSLMPQKWLITLDAFPDGALELRRLPVTQIDSIKYVDVNGIPQTLATNAYTLDAADELRAWALPAYGTSWPDTRGQANAVEVVYAAGYSTPLALPAASQAAVPAAIKQWVLLRVGDYMEHLESTTTGAQTSAHEFVPRLLDRYRIYSV